MRARLLAGWEDNLSSARERNERDIPPLLCWLLPLCWQAGRPRRAQQPPARQKVSLLRLSRQQEFFTRPPSHATSQSSAQEPPTTIYTLQKHIKPKPIIGPPRPRQARQAQQLRELSDATTTLATPSYTAEDSLPPPSVWGSGYRWPHSVTWCCIQSCARAAAREQAHWVSALYSVLGGMPSSTSLSITISISTSVAISSGCVLSSQSEKAALDITSAEPKANTDQIMMAGARLQVFPWRRS
jgi:hypothetical protein